MRTALILLFLLAVAAVPGSLLPQRPLNPGKTRAWIAAHGGWGRFLDRVGMFDVFGAPWFAAIYLLLGVSLVGCLVPRIRVHLRALRTAPLPAPKRLDRLPESGRFAAAGEPATLAQAARGALGRRWRVTSRTERSGAVTVSAEKGYLRETGNLIFHVALLVAVIAVAVDKLYSYEGSVIVQQGRGFCDTAVDLDSLHTGRLAQGGHLAPICVDKLNRFTARYTGDGEPISFAADVTYTLGADGAPRRDTITVNHPLRVAGARVYLTGHGFSPTFTVRMPDGSTRTTSAAFLPQDAFFTSEGAVKLAGKGTGNDIGIDGVFAADGVTNTRGVLRSGSPAPLHPAVAVLVYRGDLGLGNGIPQNVYTLDARQIAAGKLRHIGTATLTPGQTKKLPGGVRVTFDGYTQWANFQISHNPGQNYLLLAALGIVTGLLASLSIRRRRVWLRLTGDAVTEVEVGGLARIDSGNFPSEFSALLERLRAALPTPQSEPDPMLQGTRE
jgi:cytochrome c biogenesis protein